MKFIFALFVLSVLNITGTAQPLPALMDNEPQKKPKTDAMLFGGVKSEGVHIPFATITIKGTTIGGAANATGHFAITNLPVGKQIVVISAVGYKPVEKEVELISNKSVTVLVELEPDVIGLEQVVVSANRNEKSRKEVSNIVNSIKPELFERMQSVTLSEGLNFSPGIRIENNCQNCGFSQIRMNGLEGPYSQILINSRPVFSGLAGVYGLELIPVNMIERVEVIRGGGSSMYGSNAIAGTINLITKDPIANNFEAWVTNGTVGIDNNLESTNDFNVKLNGSFVNDNFSTGLSIFGFHRQRGAFDANSDGFSELSKLDNTTIGARLYQRIANRGKFTIDYFNINESRRGGNKFELPMHESDIAESADHAINSAAVNFDQLLRDNDKFSAFFSIQAVNRDTYYGAEQDLSAYGKTNDFTYSAGLQYIRNISNLFFAPATLITGIESTGGSLEDEKLGYFDPDENEHYGNTCIADQVTSTQAAFLQSEWKTKKFVCSAGLRFDHYNISEKTHNDDVSGDVLSPRLSFMYNLSKHLQLRAGFARGFRAPQIFDEDLHVETSGSRRVLHKNDPGLKQESSNSFSASLDFSGNSGSWQYQFLTEVFYTKLIHPFANEFGEPDVNGVVVYTRVNAEKGASVNGLNLEFNASPSNKFQFQSGFTFQKSMFEKEQEFGEIRFFRTPDTYGYISLNYNPIQVLNIAFTGNYTGSMLVPYFGSQLADPGAGELRKSNSFFDAGLKLSYDIKITDDVKIQLNGGIKNIFNSFQHDFDSGIDRDPGYIYGPLNPRTLFFGLKIGNLY